MKIKVLLLALGCTMGTLGAYAQKGVDNGTQFGSGEDSVRCITNISLFVPYAKAGNFKDAFDFWKDRKSTRLNSSHASKSRMPSSA